jgi:hypothetical protein
MIATVAGMVYRAGLPVHTIRGVLSYWKKRGWASVLGTLARAGVGRAGRGVEALP